MDKQIYDEMNSNEERFWWFQARRSIICRLLKIYVKDAASKTVLDIGCGTGMMASSLHFFHSVTALDREAHAVEIARGKGIDARIGSLPDDIPDLQADALLMLDVLEHIEDDQAAVNRCRDLLRRDGILLATVPANPFLWSNWDVIHHHKRRYSMKSFRSLFDPLQWKCELVSHYNTFLFPPAFLVRLLGKNTDSSYKPPIAPLNWCLKTIFEMEKYLLPAIPFPFGLSIIGIVRKV